MAHKNIRKIFMTGATGFLGSHLLRLFLTEDKNEVYVLMKPKNNEPVSLRKNILINKIFPKSIRNKARSRIYAVKGDVTKQKLGLSKNDLYKLRQIHTVYHCAAICKFNYPLNVIRKTNVKGTENLLKAALKWQKEGCLENINHISTVYIAGNHTGTFYEEDSDVSQKFNNTYEQSKFEAELLVSKYRKSGLRVDIYRPSIITDTIPPSTDIIPGLLRILVMFILEIFKKIPANNDTKLNMIPVDAAAKAIHLISNTKNRPLNQNYHIINPTPVNLGTLLNASSDFFGFKKPKCIPAAEFHMRNLGLTQQKIIKPFIPYLNQKLSFPMKNTTSVLKRHDFMRHYTSKEGLNKVFDYYRSSGFIPQKSDSVIRTNGYRN